VPIIMKLDEAQTQAWNTWFEQGFRNHLGPVVERVNDALTRIHKEIDESATNTALDEVAKDLAKVAKDLETKVIETRANVSKEIRDDLNKVLPSIPAEIESMRKRLWDDLIFKFGCDLNIMLADVKSLIRKKIEDEVREVVRKEINQLVTKRRYRYSKPPNVTDIDTKRKA
jgi:chemotaxis regulatin CheY-phosphate phosphatase CheZ